MKNSPTIKILFKSNLLDRSCSGVYIVIAQYGQGKRGASQAYAGSLHQSRIRHSESGSLVLRLAALPDTKRDGDAARRLIDKTPHRGVSTYVHLQHTDLRIRQPVDLLTRLFQEIAVMGDDHIRGDLIRKNGDEAFGRILVQSTRRLIQKQNIR